MTVACEIAFWIGVSWLGYVYVGYPTALWVLGVFRSSRRSTVQADDELPTVSILVSARNEQKDIGWKIAETLAWDYPSDKLEMIVASDASEDGTDEILRNVGDRRFRCLRLETRQGKNEALNHLAEMARGEVLFFTDANSHIEPGCLRQMVRHFADPKVGCVTGTERTIRSDEVAMVSGTRAFLEYESMVNTLESRLGSVLVCDGSIFCIRARLFSTLQPDLANDLELPIRIGAVGYAILFDRSTVSWEKATTVPREEFHRKKRICGQGCVGLFRMRGYLSGFRAWQFLSRKILRWLGAVPLAIALIANLMLFRSPFYGAVLAVQLGFYTMGLVGWWLASKNSQANRLLTLPFYFLTVNIAALMGICAALRGTRFSVWESPAQSRGHGIDGRNTDLSAASSALSSGAAELQRQKYQP